MKRKKLTKREVSRLKFKDWVYVSTYREEIPKKGARSTERITRGEDFLGIVAIIGNNIWVEPKRIDRKGRYTRLLPGRRFPALANDLYQLTKEDLEWSQQQS